MVSRAPRGAPEFHALSAPTFAEVEQVAQWTHARIEKVLLAHALRHMARPPQALDRLSLRDDGQVVYRFKKPWSDGTDAVAPSPQDFIARLCALVPPSRCHRSSSRSSRRTRSRSRQRSAAARSRPSRCGIPWSWLQQRVFAVDVLKCEKYGVGRSARRFPRATAFRVYLTNPSMRAALLTPVAADDPATGDLVETAVLAQWFHARTPIHYARWDREGGEVDLVGLLAAQRPTWVTEVKWTDRPEDDPGRRRRRSPRPGGALLPLGRRGVGRASDVERSVSA